jgi:hypothetical protein
MPQHPPRELDRPPLESLANLRRRDRQSQVRRLHAREFLPDFFRPALSNDVDGNLK